jgi:hypothetical protein
MPKQVLLSESQAAFLQSGITINMAGRGKDNRTSVTRVYGCSVSADRSTVNVYVYPSHCEQLLEYIQDNGVIAVVFSRPSSHETLQLKSTDAALRELTSTDLPIMQSYRQQLIGELAGLGYPDHFTYALVPEVDDSAVVICFTPQLAFIQTPGPKAGEKLNP